MAQVTIKTSYYPKDTHKGFIITLSVTRYYNNWGFEIDSNKHYELCKDDNTTLKPWNRAANRLSTYFPTIENAKSFADKLAKGEEVAYTDADRAKYVDNYNRKNNWEFNKNMLLATMRMHQKGDRVMKKLMEDRLEGANFHGYCGDLMTNDYGSFMQRIENDLKCGYL